MRAITRGSKAAVAAALAIGLALVGAPAFAADNPTPVVTITENTFPAGSWGNGVEANVTGVPEGEGVKVFVYVGMNGEFGGGALEEVEASKQLDGSYDANLYPDETPVVPDAKGYPKYIVGAYYTLDGTSVNAAPIPLTITEGISVTGVGIATPEQLAAGVTVQLAGFVPNEEIFIAVVVRKAGDAYFSAVLSEVETTAGANGSSSYTFTAPGVAVGDTVLFYVENETGWVNHYVDVVAEVPADPTPTAPVKPVKVDTGL